MVKFQWPVLGAFSGLIWVCDGRRSQTRLPHPGENQFGINNIRYNQQNDGLINIL